MEDNPYSKLIGMMRRQGKKAVPLTFSTGIVLSVSPLSVQIGGLTMSGSELLVNPQLLPGYIRKAHMTDVRPPDPPGEFTCLAELTDAEIKSGDTVAVLTLDGGQQFIVLCKVVSA